MHAVAVSHRFPESQPYRRMQKNGIQQASQSIHLNPLAGELMQACPPNACCFWGHKDETSSTSCVMLPAFSQRHKDAGCSADCWQVLTYRRGAEPADRRMTSAKPTSDGPSHGLGHHKRSRERRQQRSTHRTCHAWLCDVLQVSSFSAGNTLHTSLDGPIADCPQMCGNSTSPCICLSSTVRR